MSIINRIKDEYESFSKELKTERDDINVRLHLLSMEAKEEWGELEKKYEHFKSSASRVSDVAEDSAEEVGSALKLLGEELKKGYKRIKDVM